MPLAWMASPPLSSRGRRDRVATGILGSTYCDRVLEHLLVASCTCINKKRFHPLEVPRRVCAPRNRICVQGEQCLAERPAIVEGNDVPALTSCKEVGLTAAIVTDDR